MSNLEEVIINNIVNSKSLVLFTFHCSQLNRSKLVITREFLKNDSQLLESKFK